MTKPSPEHWLHSTCQHSAKAHVKNYTVTLAGNTHQHSAHRQTHTLMWVWQHYTHQPALKPASWHWHGNTHQHGKPILWCWHDNTTQYTPTFSINKQANPHLDAGMTTQYTPTFSINKQSNPYFDVGTATRYIPTFSINKQSNPYFDVGTATRYIQHSAQTSCQAHTLCCHDNNDTYIQYKVEVKPTPWCWHAAHANI